MAARTDEAGRVAVPEVAELLHLQRPAAGIAAAAVVLLGLLTSLLAPSVVPPSPWVGLLVGVLAVLAATATAVVLDGRDPVLRGPRHLRRDGYSVLARMSGPDPELHAGPVLDALLRRLAERDHLSLVLAGTGTDPSALARVLGHGAAGEGHTSLVVDLRAAGAPGVADVGDGTVRLGEAARLAPDRPFAWIGAGADRAAAVRAAAGVAQRPPRDLQLLVVVAPEAATHAPDLLQACDRTVLLVTADTQQRAMVSARLDALERAGGRPEAVVVGGINLADDDGSLLVDDEPFAPAPHEAEDEVPTASTASRIAPLAPYGAQEPADPDPVDADPVAPDPAAPDEPPASALDAAAPLGEVEVPDPGVVLDAAAPADEVEAGDLDDTPATAGGGGSRLEVELDDVVVVEDDAQVVGASVPPAPPMPGTRPDTPTPPPPPPAPRRPAEPSARAEASPLAPVEFRTAGAAREVAVDGLADVDPLRTSVAVQQLLARHED